VGRGNNHTQKRPVEWHLKKDTDPPVLLFQEITLFTSAGAHRGMTMAKLTGDGAACHS